MMDLSPQQTRVVELIAQGLSTKRIAARMGLSPSTVKQHIYIASRALGVSGRLQLALRYLESRGDRG